MGTRADFYTRNEKSETKMDWLGSIAWDGYPDGIEQPLLKAKTEKSFKKALSNFFKDRTDVTLPKDGWPWPWDDSRTTDYAYIFENGKVMASCFGDQLFDPLNAEPDNDEELKIDSNYFPDMSGIKNVQLGAAKSGLMIFASK